MTDASDEENDQTEEYTEDYTEGGEENDETQKSRKSVGEENEDESESGEENEGDEENEDEDGSEGGEENEENNSTNEGAEDGEAASPDGIDIDVDNDTTKETVKKLTMKEKFNDMERKKILIASLIFSLMVSLPSGLGIGFGTAPYPDYCAYPKFKACRDNGKCLMVGGMAECECNEGWAGELCKMQNCDHPDACVAENSIPSQCSFSEKLGVTCNCKEGFTGRTCSEVVVSTDYCTLPKFKTCRDNGVCTTHNGMAECECNTGWGGELCELKNCDHPDACDAENSDSSKCSFSDELGVICHCNDGFTGRTCSDEIDLCNKGEYSNCNNHGTCSMIDGLPTCTCESGWTGVTCGGPSCDQTNICENIGEDGNTASCDDSDGYAVCICNSGFLGVKCEFDSVNSGGFG